METSCVAIVRGGLTPAKARTVPNRMDWVNGCGCQRAYSYRYCAAEAEMPLAFRSLRPSRLVVLSGSVLTSRTAGYVTRASGGVGGALSDGRPYPYRPQRYITYGPVTYQPKPMLLPRMSGPTEPLPWKWSL